MASPFLRESPPKSHENNVALKPKLLFTLTIIDRMNLVKDWIHRDRPIGVNDEDFMGCTLLSWSPLRIEYSIIFTGKKDKLNPFLWS